MIKYITGNLLDCQAEALVNTVNCVGVMGRGIALQFKKKYPANFKAYEKACHQQQVQPGKMFVFDTQQLVYPRFIINFPTKRHWKEKSRIDDIELGLQDLVDVIQKYHIRSIAIPPLGAGLGGLEWHDVRRHIEASLGDMSDVEIFVYEPQDVPKTEKIIHEKEAPKMTAGRAALIELMQRYLEGLLDPFISLLEVHKLMYFMQESGENLRLRYVKYHYGPYADNLRHVLNAIEGYFIEGYQDGGDMPNKPLSLLPGAVEDAKKFLQQSPIHYQHCERVIKLVEGFESSFGLELLATVHWSIAHDKVSKNNLVEHIYQWNQHKRQFTERQIAIAYERLHSQGWI